MQNHTTDSESVRALRREIKAGAAVEDPPVTLVEIADEMTRLDVARGGERDGSYSSIYLGQVLNGHEDHRPHVPGYLRRAKAALEAIVARRQAGVVAPVTDSVNP